MDLKETNNNLVINIQDLNKIETRENAKSGNNDDSVKQKQQAALDTMPDFTKSAYEELWDLIDKELDRLDVDSNEN
ncbi:hypothetical protein WDU94_013077, partial [Cyamophila willieti]